MICERCGHSVQEGELTCENCGSFLGAYSGAAMADTGVRAIRQGRGSASGATIAPPSGRPEVKEYGDFDLSAVPVAARESASRARTAAQITDRRSGPSRADTRRGVPVNAYGRAPAVPRRSGRLHSVDKRGINWMLIMLIAVCLASVAGIGYWIYMSKTDSGQRATARRNVLSSSEAFITMAITPPDPLDTAAVEERDELLKRWNDVPAQSYWLVGQEYLDVGDVQMAVLAFKMADVLDPENYDGLLLLASAYELESDDESAEKVYLQLEESVSPFRTEAYTALIRMYQEQGRRPEAADMMKRAYEQTDKENFRLQRKDYIPLTPQVDLSAGRYEMEQPVSIISPQGYDVYYTTDAQAELPDGGTLLTEPTMTLHEGTITLRAVCVSGDLVSDPLSVTYTIFYPTPPAPKCNLAPNTYKTAHTVSLRAGEGAEKEELTYYYTIDGSMPTLESPVYDGTPIKLPSGRVYLRAVCVNKYGKMSSTLEVFYKFNIKPDPLKEYSEEDGFVGFRLNETTPNDFEERFGKATSQQETTYLNMDGEGRHLEYPWGYAVFLLRNSKWQLVRIEMKSAITSEPRGVGIGSSEADIIGVYKDFGQLMAPNGTRSLYYNYPATGVSEPSADGGRTVTYTCSTMENNNWTIIYHIASDGRCDKVTHFYTP